MNGDLNLNHTTDMETKPTPTINIKEASQEKKQTDKPHKKEIAAILPLRGYAKDSIDYNPVLIRKCLESLKESTEINRIIVSVDDPALLEQVEKQIQCESVLRPRELSGEGVRVQDVLSYTLKKIGETSSLPELIVPVEITYPFRPTGIFDQLIGMYRTGSYDTVIAGVPEYRVCWKEEGQTYTAVTDLSNPRSQRKPLYIGLPSLGCVIEPEIVLEGRRYGDTLGILQVDEPFATVEIRTPEQLKQIAKQLYWPVSQ